MSGQWLQAFGFATFLHGGWVRRFLQGYDVRKVGGEHW
jgi:hypothetical protein